MTLKFKWGLRSGNEPRYLGVRLRGVVDLIRPLTVLPAFTVGLLGGIILHLQLLVAFIFALVFAMFQGGGQALNQANPTEIMLDRLNNKVYRPTVSGVLSSKDAYIVGYTLIICATAVGFVYGVGAASLLMAFTAISYTQQPLYLKRFFPLSLLIQAAGRGFLPIYVLGELAHRSTLTLAIFFLLWVVALQSTKDFGDVNGDSVFGIRTLPTLLGVKWSKIAMLGLSGVAYVYAVVAHLYVLFAMLPLDITAILTADRPIKVAENSLGWVLFYTSLGLGYILALTIYA
ncbi:MAG: UbiA family prenyltransferase [Thermoprotei archaeon]